MQQDTYFKLGPNGISKVVVQETPPVDPAKFLRSFADNSGIVVHRVDEGAHLLVSRREVTVILEVYELPVHTNWGLDLRGVDVSNTDPATLDPVLVPTFTRNNGTIVMRRVWATDNPLLFAVRFTGTGIARDVGCSCVYLINGQTHRPPFPNIYEDGRVCMGYAATTQVDLRKGTLLGYARAQLESFKESTWNTDLLTSGVSHASKDLIRFSPEGEQLPMIGTMEEVSAHLPVVSSSQFVGVVPVAGGLMQREAQNG